MSVRSVSVTLRANIAQYARAMRDAIKQTVSFRDELAVTSAEGRAALTDVGQAAAGFGAAIGVGLGLAAKAAIDWESAWTGVLKVVDATPEQLDALEGQLRDLATTLPQTHEEIAGVAAAAGQLGIATEDIAQFTQVMVAMGVSTDLSSEEAAMSLARLMNIMQSAPEDVDNLGSAIVGLGNAGASTEREIVEMALRIAGAGHTIGLSEDEVLAFSSALASVGIEAEAGGSAISTAFVLISEAVNEGGDSLETLASVAGTTADKFALKFSRDPAKAIDAFVTGLGRMQATGGDVFATLESLGMSEIRLRDALLRLAGAGDLLTESLGDSSTAWDQNRALMEEAERRYGTTASQIQIAKNQITEMGAELGETLLPAINDTLRAGRGFFAWFEELSPAVKEVAVQLGVATAVISLVGGAALLAAPKLQEMSLSMGQLGRAGPAKALSGVARLITGPWGAAVGIGAAVIGQFAFQQAEAKGRVEDLSNTLDDQTGAITDNTRVMIANELERQGVIDTAEELGVSLAQLVDAIEGDPAAMEAVNDAIARRREELVELAGQSDSNLTQIDAERGALTDLQEATSGLSGETQEAIEQKQRQLEIQGAVTQATDNASGAEQVLAENLGITTEAAAEASDAFSDLDEKVRALIDSAFALNDANRDVEAGIDTLVEKLEENGATVDRNTEAGRENEQAIEDQVQAIADLALTTAEQTGSTEEANDVLNEQRNRLHDVLEQAGLTEEQIQDYIGVLDDIPSEIETAVNAHINITSTETVNRIIIDQFGRNANQIVERWGGVTHHAQRGLLRADVYSPRNPARYAFAEPATGGEAFIPRLGDRERSMAILGEAASWYGASVVDGTQWRGRPSDAAAPEPAGSSRGRRFGQVYVERQEVAVHAHTDTFSYQQTMDDIAWHEVS